MIRRITIKNFRSHEHTVLELHPHVNAIIGRGQAGKTNIKRSVEWVANNRPLGNKFVSWWANGEPTEVTIVVDAPEGDYMVRMTKPGDGSATYKLDGPEWAEPQIFEKMGTKVPDAVRNVLNLDTVNMQNQLDQPYLVTGSKGDISRAVNRVIEAEVADEWLRELNSRDAQNNQHIKALEAVIDNQHEAVARLNNVPKAEEWIVKAELEDRRLSVAKRRADGIKQLLDSLARAEEQVAHVAGTVEPLAQMAGMADAVQAEIAEVETKAEAINALLRADGYVNELGKQYQNVAARYVQLLEKLGQCPTCLSPVDADRIAQLKEAL
jgi:DNA repair exonuclease SbcCD ATPase subunit